jgi:hypothetical protein
LKRINVGDSALLLIRDRSPRFKIEQGQRSQSTP